jgi:hypothetical protein
MPSNARQLLGLVLFAVFSLPFTASADMGLTSIPNSYGYIPANNVCIQAPTLATVNEIMADTVEQIQFLGSLAIGWQIRVSTNVHDFYFSPQPDAINCYNLEALGATIGENIANISAVTYTNQGYADFFAYHILSPEVTYFNALTIGLIPSQYPTIEYISGCGFYFPAPIFDRFAIGTWNGNMFSIPSNSFLTSNTTCTNDHLLATIYALGDQTGVVTFTDNYTGELYPITFTIFANGVIVPNYVAPNPSISSFSIIGSTSAHEMIASVGNATKTTGSTLWVIVALAVSIPLAFFVFDSVISLLRENEAIELHKNIK